MSLTGTKLTNVDEYIDRLTFRDGYHTYTADFYWHDRCIMIDDEIGNGWMISNYRPPNAICKLIIGTQLYVSNRGAISPLIPMETFQELAAMKTWK